MNNIPKSELYSKIDEYPSDPSTLLEPSIKLTSLEIESIIQKKQSKNEEINEPLEPNKKLKDIIKQEKEK